jgi:hypothetical protein
MPQPSQGVAEGESGMFSKVMGHETTPEAARQIQQQGFKKSHTGIFFNVGNQNYSGGGYGGTVVMAKVSGPIDDILNLEDDNDLPDNLDDFADGEEIANYAREEGYWAWTDGVQFAVLDPRHIQVVKQGVAEGYLNEASSDEAWELVGQPVPEIQQFVKQMGYGYDDQSVAKITAVIDRVISTQLPVASIPKLKNLANKGTDVQTLKAVQQISGKPDAEQQYTKLMKARDAAEGRERDVSGYLQYVKSGNYDPPVLLKLPTGIYVIGGRTRLYAALALGVPANVKIISANDFQQGVAENFADGKNPGRKGLSKRVGVNTKASVSSLRKTAKNSSGEKQRMAHWLANMKSGRAKAKRK